MEETEPQLLFCGFCDVPGTSASGARLHQMIASIPDTFLVDALATRGVDTPHIERVGNARLMRVQVGPGFLEGIASYQRAVQRQLTSDVYQLVYCADIFSGQIAATLKKARGFSLVVEVNDLPSSSFHRRYPVSPRDKALRKRWHATEREVLRAADKVVASSRHAARLLSERVDPRKIELIARSVDLTLFAPPTVEIALDDRKTIAVFGGPEGRESTRAGHGIAAALGALVDPEQIRVAWIGTPIPGIGVPANVDLIAVDGPARVASALADAAVVVIPTAADTGAELWGVPHRALESMGCGRPTIIIGEDKAFSDVIKNGEDALVFPPASAEEIAAAAIDLLGDEAARDRLGRAGLRAVQERAEPTGPRDEFAALITRLVGTKMELNAGDGTNAYEATQLSTAPQVSVSLPPPPVVDIASDEIMPIELTGAGYDDEGAFEARPTDVVEPRPIKMTKSSPNVIRIKTTTKPVADALTEGALGTEEESVPAALRSLHVNGPSDEGSDDWGAGLETEILPRDDDEAPSIPSDTERNVRSPSVSSSTFATLQAIQAEIEEQSDNPWGEGGTNDTIADAAPVEFDPLSVPLASGSGPKRLLADGDGPEMTEEEAATTPSSDG